MKKKLTKRLTKTLVIVFSLILIVFFALLIISSCGGNGDDYNFNGTGDNLLTYFDELLPIGTIEFTHLIMNSEDFDRIIPLGQINPIGHTFPTDHIQLIIFILC
ncbi:MAG: hypothetical protein WCR54_08135 [Clostridia bacterium]